MSKFFQKVATPETGRQQSVSAGGPTTDANARAEAENDFNSNLGSAIMDLVGTTAKTIGAVKTYNKAEKAKLRAESQLDINADLADLGSYMKTFIDSKEEGKSIHDYEPDELRSVWMRLLNRLLRVKA